MSWRQPSPLIIIQNAAKRGAQVAQRAWRGQNRIDQSISLNDR